jgi:pimeloyl-ACP methyl ester carboxylesterase
MMKQIRIFIIVLFAISSLQLKAQNNQVRNHIRMTEIIDNGDTKLFTTIYPNIGKETIILLHGGPGFPGDLTEVAETLADKYQVITFHQRGTKKSPSKSHNYSMESYISDIDRIAAHYKLEKFHLFGHSWGGLYAQIYAQQRPQKLLSLFLCSPGSGTGNQWTQTEKEVMQLNKSKSTSGEWMKMGVNNLLGMLGSSSAYKRLFKQVMINYNEDFVRTDNLTIDFDNLKAAPINRTRKEIAKYPVLLSMPNPGFKISIAYGDKDIYKSSKNFVLSRYPTASTYTLENSGHIPWLHNPEKYRTILSEHFKL